MKRIFCEEAAPSLDHVFQDAIRQIIAFTVEIQLRRIILIVTHQTRHVLERQPSFRIQFIHHTIRRALLADLAVVNLLLQRIVRHETINKTLLRLAVPKFETTKI